MSPETQHFYDFGDFRLDPAEKVLLRDGKFIPVTPKVFETLSVLVESAGRTVEKDELMQRIWQERFVEESNLTFNIGMLRKALGDDASKPRYVETVPRRGYRFIAEVKRVANDEDFGFGISDFGFENGGAKTNGGQTANGHAAESNGANSLNGNSLAEKTAVGAATNVLPARRPRLILYSLAAILIAACAAAFFVRQKQSAFGEKSGGADKNTESLSVEKLTDSGNVNGVSISPDGKLLAYFTSETGKVTVWLRQLATGKSIPIFTTEEDFITKLAFSPDGEYIYFSHSDETNSPTLSRLSILGGSPTGVLSGVHGSFDFSPDGNQIVFTRVDGEGTHLLVSDLNGAGERRMSTVPKPRFVTSLDWSPGGEAIAVCAGGGKLGGAAADYEILKLNLADRTETRLTGDDWKYIENAKWLPGGDALLLTGRKTDDDTKQIWRLTLSDGRAERITNSSAALYLSDASADFSRIVATQGALGAAVWIAPKADASKFKLIAKSHWEMSWTPDSRIVFAAKDTARTTIWRMNPDGGDKRQLTSDDRAVERAPAVSPDNRYVVFLSTSEERRNVWRTDADGGNRVRLTSGEGENYPVFTHDGKSVVYNSDKDGSLWRVSIQGGEPAQIFTDKTWRVAFAPGGGQIAFFGRRDGQRKLFVKSFPGGEITHEFDAPSSNATPPKIVWAKDARTIFYSDSDETLEIDNLWQQPLGGGERRQLTNFDAEWIYDFGFSPDDRWLAVVRGAMNYDAVLLKGFK